MSSRFMMRKDFEEDVKFLMFRRSDDFENILDLSEFSRCNITVLKDKIIYKIR